MKATQLTQPAPQTNLTNASFLVIGGGGKTGRRVIERLEKLGHQTRSASRSSEVSFDWHDESNWHEVLAGVKSLYLTYHPDLSVPGASDHIRALLSVAQEQRVEKIVLLSGRGEEEAQLCERLVLNSGIPAIVVRCGWFNQNFSESFFRDLLMSGTLAVPNAHVGEGYLDADDIADVVTAALTEEGHDGQVYQLTGPELLTFREIAAIFHEVTGRELTVMDVSREDLVKGLEAAQLPQDMIQLVDYLFNEVLDGRNSSLGDGVQRALGRPPRNFRSFLQKAHLSGAFGQRSSGRARSPALPSQSLKFLTSFHRMTTHIIFNGFLLLAVLSTLLVTGLLFTFALLVMPGLGQLEDRAFLRGFQEIDRIIQRSPPLCGGLVGIDRYSDRRQRNGF